MLLRYENKETTQALTNFQSLTAVKILSHLARLMGDIFAAVTLYNSGPENYKPQTNRLMSFVENEASLCCTLTTTI